MTKKEAKTKKSANETKQSQPEPEKRTKVAIVGFAPSSMKLAPFGDESYEIWTLNNVYTAFDLPRWDRWFELHHNFRDYADFHDNRVDPASIVSGNERPVTKKINHLEWLQGQTTERPIYFIEPQPDIPAAKPYPLHDIINWCQQSQIIPYFTNTISYMIALAIAEGYKTIAVYGVDMAADGEYQKEKPSVEYWLGQVQRFGIELIIPKESELLCAPLYGFTKPSPFLTKLNTRAQELLANHQRAVAEAANADRAAHYFKGAYECQMYNNSRLQG